MTNAPIFDFIEHTLQSDAFDSCVQHWANDRIRVQHLDTGILRLSPTTPSIERPYVLLSCGIHGNETAPIEVVNELLLQLQNQTLSLEVELLILFGNPAAMRQNARFIDYDMNRLFNGSHDNFAHTQEFRRAKVLEQAARLFFEEAAQASKLHYDLHTAIRGSVFERFAIYPYLHDRPYNTQQLMWLQQANIDTILLHTKPTSTFSYFTSVHFNADAFTLELGKARPFKQNDLSRFSGIQIALANLISHQTPTIPSFDSELIHIFKAKYDLIKRSDRFVLNLADDVENFTLLADGMIIASDDDVVYQAEGGQERILFPNPKVKAGLRAGIVIEPTTL